MKILELFAGTCSFSKVARELGHEVITMDNDPQHDVDIVKDIFFFNPKKDLPKGWKPDFIWASPPCTSFSVASIHHYWKDGKPKNAKCLLGIAIVKRTIEIIKELNPRYWIIENPRGMLRKQLFMTELNRDTVTYCQYGAAIQKPTDLWNNLNHKFKPMCKPGSPCHEPASRGARNGVQGINNSFSNLGSAGRVLRAVVPEELCREILTQINTKEKKDV
ncbi:MAG: DNA cytosine methyltransferase [Parcubacteria group bacterium]|nr:DNA cytosine methyltransferase [Parcubacteria group bacterium]